MHLRLLPRNPPDEEGVEPRVQEVRPVADAPLVRSQGHPVARVELAWPNLQNVGCFEHTRSRCVQQRGSVWQMSALFSSG